MAYCRWSSDDWRSDVYCYGDASGGYTTHVAEKRIVGNIPPLAGVEDPKAFVASYEAQIAALDKAKRERIGGPYDGETFNDASLEDFLERLEGLRDAGYHVPADVFDAVREEIAEE